jgi:hypothetical protein
MCGSRCRLGVTAYERTSGEVRPTRLTSRRRIRARVRLRRLQLRPDLFAHQFSCGMPSEALRSSQTSARGGGMAQACSMYTAWYTVTARDSEVRCEPAAPRRPRAIGTRPLEPLGLAWLGVADGEARRHMQEDQKKVRLSTHTCFGSVWLCEYCLSVSCATTCKATCECRANLRAVETWSTTS